MSSTADESADFEKLKARADGLGWELIDKTDKSPFYLLAGKDSHGNPTTHSAVRLYPRTRTTR